MAIKIPCGRCHKKISIDEAFAGGVCRCPYCTGINNVPLSGSPARSAHRPSASAGKPGAKAVAKGKPGRIPVANRVLFQGITAVFLIVVVLLFVGGGVALLMVALGGEADANGEGGPDPSLPVNPFEVASRPAVAGNLHIESPVVYVVDTSSSMRAAFAYTQRMVETSLQTLPSGAKVAGIVSGEETAQTTGSVFLTASEGRSRISALLGGVMPMGAAEIVPALDRAMAMKPATIVLIARKHVDEAFGLADRAKMTGVKIVTVVPGGRGDVASSMAELATRTGGASRVMNLDQLATWASQAPTR